MTRIVALKEEEQGVHDRAIEEITTQLKLANAALKFFTNPDNMHNCKVEGYYPDICGDKGGRILLIGEVEVENSVNEKEAEQWRLYSLLRRTFYLYVPKTKAKEAEGIINSKDIKVAELWAFTLASSGVKLEKIQLEE